MSEEEHPNVIKIKTAEEFEAMRAKSSETAMLVDFYADWCPPCRSLKPVLIKLAESFNGSFKLAICDCDIPEL
jgi:putative thioredoxin